MPASSVSHSVIWICRAWEIRNSLSTCGIKPSRKTGERNFYREQKCEQRRHVSQLAGDVSAPRNEVRTRSSDVEAHPIIRRGEAEIKLLEDVTPSEFCSTWSTPGLLSVFVCSLLLVSIFESSLFASFVFFFHFLLILSGPTRTPSIRAAAATRLTTTKHKAECSLFFAVRCGWLIHVQGDATHVPAACLM